jgi:alpha-beta hydrolase superfamily lysophospholipase
MSHVRHLRRHAAWLLLVLALAASTACAPKLQQIGPPVGEPQLAEDSLIMPDGAALPLRRWLPPDGAPRAVILALHGFNDYSNAFEEPARAWAAEGVATYAYDQRGFGAAPEPGIWAGEQPLIEDLRVAARLVRARHPDTPFYLLGESMGGAVVMAAATTPDPLPADGLILVAPAVWGRETAGFLQNAMLWLAAHTIPWMKFTGEDLDIWPTDNIEILRRMSRDPLVLKETRVDAIDGLVNMMDLGYAATARLRAPALILYGSQEQVLPADAILSALRNLPAESSAQQRIAIYPKGYHMLLRDLQADVVRRDVLAWLADPAVPLPSGGEQVARRILERGEDSLKLDASEEDSVADLLGPAGDVPQP